eukprot:765196-Hanusia_phi.AAC.4
MRMTIAQQRWRTKGMRFSSSWAKMLSHRRRTEKEVRWRGRERKRMEGGGRRHDEGGTKEEGSRGGGGGGEGSNIVSPSGRRNSCEKSNLRVKMRSRNGSERRRRGDGRGEKGAEMGW